MIDFTLSDEQVAMTRMVRELMREQVAPRVQEIDERAEFPAWVADLFREIDLFAVVAPEEYGGIDGSQVTLVVVTEEVARICPSSSMILGVQALGGGPIMLFGSEEQKRRWLPALSTGAQMVAFGLTEPGAGSDVRAMTTRAVAAEGGWILNGRKNFISHANVADLAVVFAQVKREGRDEITAFVVETAQPGFCVDKIEQKMGLRGSPTCSFVLEDAWVPEDNLLGEVGGGMAILLGTLHKSRIHSASQALGLAQGALDLAAAYAVQREQFGRRLADMQAVQTIVGQAATRIGAARSLVYAAASKWDAKAADLPRYSSMAKLFASDTAMRTTTDAVQIMGGYGYMSEYGVERFMRDAKVFQIFEGANQLHETAVAKDVFARV